TAKRTAGLHPAEHPPNCRWRPWPLSVVSEKPRESLTSQGRLPASDLAQEPEFIRRPRRVSPGVQPTGAEGLLWICRVAGQPAVEGGTAHAKLATGRRDVLPMGKIPGDPLPPLTRTRMGHRQRLRKGKYVTR